ncbi:MAG: ImmA/IrrE family metallo-endopeptidase [Thermodesulfobacteriota bacterium]
MPRKSLEAIVEPKVLKWARESMGLDFKETAKRLKVVEDTVGKWESGQKKPTLIQLEKLAKIYKRPLAVFFLPEPPKEIPLPKDFRTLPMDNEKPFSLKTRLAIRRAQRLQSLATDLAKSINREIISQIGRAKLSDDPEVIAIRVRQQLGVEIQKQFSWKDENKAFNDWKKTIENRGILVFQIGIPLKEARGFSLAKGEIPAIVLNLHDSTTGRIFSLFHEYAHLLLNESGICDMEEINGFSGEARSIEKFCNHFAGAALVPKNALLDHQLIRSKEDSSPLPDEVLQELAKAFKVSQEVILRRLLILGRSTRDFYKRKREEWEAKVKRGEQRQRKWGRINPPKKCIRENGVPFVSLVLDTHREGKITYSDVADYLEIRLKHLPKIEQLVEGRV